MAEVKTIHLGNMDFQLHDGCIIVRQAAEAIGLNPLAAIHHVKEDPLISENLQFRTVTLPGSRERKHVAIPVFYFYGWLLRIQIGKTKPEVHETLWTLRRECYAALYEYFKGGMTNTNSSSSN